MLLKEKEYEETEVESKISKGRSAAGTITKLLRAKLQRNR